MRPNIDDHDYDTKMKKVHDFIEEGDKVKITLRFRGRELAHQQLGMQLLERVAEDTAGNRQDRGAAPHGRPPDADGDLAEIDCFGPFCSPGSGAGRFSIMQEGRA